ncbi:MAG: polymer-forming cytoskeletal protein [Lachnospiraceae bacterium]|nr:polymer-forming cytoskeletal protein [Lachnospiraceae bacterium]
MENNDGSNINDITSGSSGFKPSLADELFDIIEPDATDEETVPVSSSFDDSFVQDDSFVNSLDFTNGFSYASEEELNEMYADIEAKMENDAVTGGADMPNIPSDDPNKMMSPDDIANLIASMNASGADNASAAPNVPAPEPEPEPAPTVPVSDDPNKMMSPDDIANLIASMNASVPADNTETIAEVTEPEPEPEPVQSPVVDDPNKMMSPDDIANLIASMGNTGPADNMETVAEVAEPEPEPVPSPVVDDPNKMMSPDDIANLIASMDTSEASDNTENTEVPLDTMESDIDTMDIPTDTMDIPMDTMDIPADTTTYDIPNEIPMEEVPNADTEVFIEDSIPSASIPVENMYTGSNTSDTVESDDGDFLDDESFDDFEDDEYEQSMIITEGTVIDGNITTDCSLDVYGTVNGDIFCGGKLSISGKVTGSSHASEIMISAKRVEGNIESEGVVKIGQGAVIIGDIKAGASVIAGAVKGNLDVKGPVILDTTAVIKGNIKAKSVQLINGAVLEGFCSLEYANSNVDEIFN